MLWEYILWNGFNSNLYLFIIFYNIFLQNPNKTPKFENMQL